MVKKGEFEIFSSYLSQNIRKFTVKDTLSTMSAQLGKNGGMLMLTIMIIKAVTLKTIYQKTGGESMNEEEV